MTNKKAVVAEPKTDKVVETSITGVDHGKWFEENIGSYRTLAEMIAATIKSTLTTEGISFVDIPFREKKKESFLKKMEDRNKSDVYPPNRMTDLAGIRVITLTESDVNKVGEIIKELFNVHQKDSMDKSDSLGTHKVGYRSVHYVCDIGEDRANLREWKVFKDLCFEIQVRTALQHAWAEIEHDRGYKLGGQLPSKISRRFSLLSGLLESADLEFSRLTDEIEKHIKDVEFDLVENKKLDPEITTAGIKTLFSHIFSDINYEPSEDEVLIKIINDLKHLNITDLNILKKMLIEVKEYFKETDNETELSILRTSILYENLQEYMEKAWDQPNNKWRNIPRHIVDILSKKYTDLNLPSFFKDYGIQIF